MTDPTPSKEAAPLTPEAIDVLRRKVQDSQSSYAFAFSRDEVAGLLATLDAARASQPAPDDPAVTDKAVSPLSAAGRAFDREFHEDWDTLCGPDCPVIAAFKAENRAALDAAPAGVRDPEPRPDHAAAVEELLAVWDAPYIDASWQVASTAEVMPKVRAALRSPVPAEGLDVERLARALRVVTRGSWSTPTRKDPDKQREQDERWLRDTAAKVAREYAALTPDTHPEPKP